MGDRCSWAAIALLECPRATSRRTSHLARGEPGREGARRRAGAQARGLEHRGDGVSIEAPGDDLVIEVRAMASGASPGRCGRGSVIAWQASAAASRRAASERSPAAAPR